MYFSYPDLLAGFDTQNDNLNLGLHEWAHAFKLWIDNDFSERQKLWQLLYEVDSRSEVYREMVSSGQITFLRHYAATNEQEFFAVCVEHFFEQPDAFKTALPQLFAKLVNLFGQHPGQVLSRQPDNAESKGVTAVLKKMLPQQLSNFMFGQAQQDNAGTYPGFVKIARTTSESWHWSVHLLWIGFLPGFIISIYVGMFTIIPVQTIMLVATTLTGVSAIYFYAKLVSSGLMHLYQFIPYLMFGVFPCSMALFLGSNAWLGTGQTETRYAISNIWFYSGRYHVSLEGKVSGMGELQLSTEADNGPAFPDNPEKMKWVITADNGLWGYPVVQRVGFDKLKRHSLKWPEPTENSALNEESMLDSLQLNH